MEKLATPLSARSLQTNLEESNDPCWGFESVKRLRKAESKYEKQIPRFIFRLSAKWRVYWDIMIVLTTIYNCLALPLFLAFNPSLLESPYTLLSDTMIDLLFISDILVNFRTTYIKDTTKEEIYDAKLIAKHYITSGNFFIDLVPSVPYDLIAFLIGAGPTGLSLLRVLKFVRVLRITKFINFMRVHETMKLSLRLLQRIIFIILYLHIIGCIWFLIVSRDEEWVPITDSILSETDIYDTGVTKQYWMSFYHSLFYLVGIEMGVSNKTQYIVSAVAYLVGAMVTAVIFGDLAVIVDSMNRKSTKFNETKNNILTTMKNMRLKEDLQMRIIDFFNSTYHIREERDEYEQFIGCLPPSFLIQVYRFIFKPTFSKNPFFKLDNALFDFLFLRMENKFFQPEFAVVDQFEEGNEFYFIASSSCGVEVFDENGTLHYSRVLEPGSYFGEVSLLYKTQRTATVRTLNYTNLIVLSADDFQEMITKFSGVKRFLLKYASTYRDKRKVFLRKTLLKVAYLNALNNQYLDELLYSMEKVNFNKRAYLFEEGEVIDKVFFILEGKVSVGIELRESSLKRIIETEKMKAPSRQPMTMLTPLVRTSKVRLPLDTVEKGGVLCSKIALINSASMVSCRAKTDVEALVLSTETLTALAEKLPRLKHHIEKTKSSFKFYDNFRDEVLYRSIPIDIYKDHANSFGLPKETWKIYTKMKNNIITLVHRRRNRLKKGIFTVKGLVERLTTVSELEKMGREEVAKKISEGKVKLESLKAVELLHLQDFENPVLSQFAARAKEAELARDFLFEKFMKSIVRCDNFSIKSEKAQNLMLDIEKLLNELIELSQKQKAPQPLFKKTFIPGKFKLP